MTDTATSTANSPEFREFMNKALPTGGGTHTLALGEMHYETAHMEWLKAHLGELQKNHAVQSLGLELESFFNLFLWAYRDGTLSEMLGSKEAAENYIKAIFVAYSEIDYQENAIKHAELTMKALDAGMDVVAYDSRDTLSSRQTVCGNLISSQRDRLQTSAREAGKTIDDLTQQQRVDISHVMSRKTRDDEDAAYAWMLEEAQMLRKLCPEYKQKLEAIETLVEVGHKKIAQGKLTSDGLSAVLFNSMAGQGNRLTLSGASHVDGVGTHYIDSKEKIHGTFANHLELSSSPHPFSPGQPAKAQRPHSVTRAIIASDASVREMNYETVMDFKNPNTLALAGHRVAHLNLDDGSADEKLWHPEKVDPHHPRIVPLAEKFPVPEVVAEKRDSPYEERAQRYHQGTHIDPLKLPDIRKAANAVRAAMHPELCAPAR